MTNTLTHQTYEVGLRRMDRLFGVILSVEWFGLGAFLLSPGTVAPGHIWTALPGVVLFLGGAIGLAFIRPGTVLTRHALSGIQVLTAAFLVHLSGGRFETHLYLWGSLAVLGLYRDWRVLATATAVAVADQVGRAILLPGSAFSVFLPAGWAWTEQAGWLGFEAALLIGSAVHAERERLALARKQKHEETARDLRFEALVNSVDGVVWESVDRTGCYAYVSNQAEALLGYPLTRWLLEPGFWEAHIDAADRTWVLDQTRKESEAHRAHELEYRMISSNGQRIWVRDRVTVMAVEGRPVTLRGVMTDITELKKMDVMKNGFVSTVSHELRTPLTSIHASLGLISEGIVGALPDATRELIDIAYQNSERLVRLVNDILDIDKMECGKVSCIMKPFDPVRMIRQSLEVNQPYADRFGIRFAFQPAAADLRVRGDFDRLVQVMTNLLSNAVKFSPPKGTVTVSAARVEKGVRISVRDTGRGVPKEFQPRIFQKFCQADTTSTRRKGGSGLGLAIAKAIVERHGGTIGYDTQEHVGSTFWFELPESPSVRPVTPAPAPALALAGRS